MEKKLIPTETLPELEIGVVGQGRWRLSENAPDFLLMMNVYRGLHCPRCRRQLEDIAALKAEFDALGVDILAVSTDPPDRAERTGKEWNVAGIPIGYGLPVETARALGCYISRAVRDTETEVFAEPGIFFVRPDLTLYGAVLNTFPFARPAAADLLEVAKVVRERDYPPRGTVGA